MMRIASDRPRWVGCHDDRFDLNLESSRIEGFDDRRIDWMRRILICRLD